LREIRGYSWTMRSIRMDSRVRRSEPADAKRRYLTAQGILERRGLGLRLPLIASKIARLG
jgi:hypothetical protein